MGNLALARKANAKLVMSRLSGGGLDWTTGGQTIIYGTWPVLLLGANLTLGAFT